MINMKKTEVLQVFLIAMIVIGTMLTYTPSFATELPESITIGDEVFIINKEAGGGKDTATPDNLISTMKSSYRVTGSDVRLYTNPPSSYSRGNSFSQGWVTATAPSFTARGEVWFSGRIYATGGNTLNRGNIANARSYLTATAIKDGTPRIFYNFK